MRTYKKNLPDGVKKAFGYERGIKVRLINKKMADKKKLAKENKNK